MVMTTSAPTTCACCHTPVTAESERITCPTCRSVHHRTCWETDGGCRVTEECARVAALIDKSRERHAQPFAHERPLHPQLPWIVTGMVVALLIIAGFVAVSKGAPLGTVLTIGVVIAALTFDYVNGMHDAGNAIATVISTRVLPPFAALIMAAVLNLLGALLHTGVATSIATKFTDPSVPSLAITPAMILCGLVGASIWSFWTARIGLPVSTSHSLFGGLIGVFLLAGIKLNAQYLGKFGMWMVLAPLMAFTVGWGLMVLIMWVFRKVATHKINRHFRFWQIISSAMMAFSHGSNDAQKAMGIITMALISGHMITVAPGADVAVPFWVKLSCATVIALGTGLGGMRVIRTLGHKIIKLDPVHGFTAEMVAATTIQLVTLMKVPISTTHVISSSILGIGASKRLSAVRWGVAINIVGAWLFTIPTCAIAGAALYWLVSSLGLK